MPTYQSTNLLARTNPLRSIPFMRPASVLIRLPVPVAPPDTIPAAAPGCSYYTPTAVDLQHRVLANAEAALREATRVYDDARRGIGEANRTQAPAVIAGGRVVMSAKAFTKQRIRERKSYAFRLFNQRRSELTRARRAVEAARAALGLSSVAAVQERQAIRQAVRASKRQPLHSIAQVAFAI